MTTPARLHRGRLAVQQLVEYLIAALLVGAALHAPHRGEILLGAAVLIGGWAALHRAPLAAAGLIGTGVHRIGLAALTVGMAALAFRYLTDVAISGPLGLATIVVGQLAIGTRSTVVEAPTAQPAESPGTLAVDPPTASPAAAPPAPTPTTSGPCAPARPAVDVGKIGYAAGQMGSLIGREAKRAVPAGARRAGRSAGRVLRHRSPPPPAPPPPAPAERLDDRPQ
jgi:hypothetical protein